MDRMQETVTTARARGLTGRYRIGLVLGTGLSPVVDLVEDAVSVSYADLPGFPVPGVTGHGGILMGGRIGEVPVLVLSGRSHFYESGDIAAMRVPLETLAALGVETLLLTCSAGSVNPEIAPGRLCIIRDHLNLSGMSPLVGEPGDGRFLPLGDAYSPTIAERLRRAAAAMSVRCAEGVYMFFPGPNFETAAEVRAARILGADLVGMSVVPEVVIARRLGLEVGAVAMVTNYGTGLAGAAPSHQETRSMASAGASELARLLARFCGDAHHGS
jgi:purine-nucleoside phosphorylase